MKTRGGIVFAVVLLLVGALGVLLTGCSGLQSKTTGAIEINLVSAISKSILPPAGSMDIASYALSGAGPDGAVFGPVILTGGNTATIDSLAPGAWVVTAVARNSVPQAIGSGTGDATVTIGGTAVCDITVLEATSPNGSYALTVEWTAEVINPTVTGKIVTAASVETAQIFVNPNVSPAVSDTPLLPGWYTNIVQLKSGTTLVGGFAEAVRVAAGRQTSVTVSLKRTGEITINITPDFADPLTIEKTPAGTEVEVKSAQANPFSIVAKMGTETVGTTNFWYLNGASLGSSATLDLDELLIPIGDTARLDVVAFSSADTGRHAGSGTWNVTRVATVEETQLITGTLDMSNWAAKGWTPGVAGAHVQFVDLPTLTNEGGGAVGVAGAYTVSVTNPGSYKLRVYVWPNSGWEAYPGASSAYWSVNGNVSNPADATVVVIPHDGKLSSVIHNFGPLP
jgi:hypothetical protein